MKNLILENYRCPDYESGLYKGIPMEYRNHPKVQELMRTRLFTVRYRGNSKVGYDRPKDFVHKDKADTFAIYPYSNYEEFETSNDVTGITPPAKYPIGQYHEWVAYREEHTKAIIEIAEKLDAGLTLCA